MGKPDIRLCPVQSGYVQFVIRLLAKERVLGERPKVMTRKFTRILAPFLRNPKRKEKGRKKEGRKDYESFLIKFSAKRLKILSFKFRKEYKRRRIPLIGLIRSPTVGASTTRKKRTKTVSQSRKRAKILVGIRPGGHGHHGLTG